MSDGKLRGVVHLIEETKTYGAKGFRKRLLVLQQDKGSFTNYVPLDFTRDDCDLLDSLQIGDEIEVTFRLSGRKWQKDSTSEVRYFMSAEGIGFQPIGDERGETGPARGRTAGREKINEAFAEVDEDEPPF